MTDLGDGDGSPRRTGPTTRRAVLKLAGLVTVLGDVPVAMSAGGRTDAGRARGPSTVSSDISGASRSATLNAGDEPYVSALAVEGDTALVGVPPTPGSVSPSVGRAMLFTRSGNTWTRKATFSPQANGGQFGRAVAMDGDVAVIGAELDPNPRRAPSGSAEVFAREDGPWTEVSTLSAPSPSGVDRFGTSVAIAENTIIVGASAATTDEARRSGAAFAFERSDHGWTQTATITPPTDDVEEFGRTVAIEDDTAVVGARQLEDTKTGDRGVVFVYRWYHGFWRRQATLTPPETTHNDRFGTTASLDDGTIAVGAPMESNEAGSDAGAVYTFTQSGTAWRRQATLHEGSESANYQFGTALAIDGNSILAGSKFGEGPVAFARSGDTWTRVRILDDDGSNSNRRGTVVALDGARAIVGGERTPDEGEHAARPVEVFESS